jgi:hypothetical protein
MRTQSHNQSELSHPPQDACGKVRTTFNRRGKMLVKVSLTGTLSNPRQIESS